MVIAVGDNFPDGLSVGSLAHTRGAPLVLTNDGKSAAAEAYARRLDLRQGIAIGGSGILSNKTVMAILSLESEGQIGVITR
jgi:hypothetical protein